MSELIQIQFLGIPNVKTRYIGDGLQCDIDSPSSCIVNVSLLKAAQLFNDHPDEWKFPKDFKDAIGDLDYSSNMLKNVQATNGIKVIHPNGTETIFPPGTKIDVLYSDPLPDEKKVEQKTVKKLDEEEVKQDKDSESDKDSDFPKPLGSGHYELSDGSKIYGKKKAHAAQDELNDKEKKK